MPKAVLLSTQKKEKVCWLDTNCEELCIVGSCSIEVYTMEAMNQSSRQNDCYIEQLVIAQFSHCCDPIPDEKQPKQGHIPSGSQFEMIPPVMKEPHSCCDPEAAGHVVSAVKKWSGQELRPSYQTPRLISSDSCPPAMFHCLKPLQPSKTTPQARDPISKHMSLWRTYRKSLITQGQA